MKASDGKKHERRFSDVKTMPHFHGPKWFKWLKNRGQIVNLKPTFYKRYPFLVLLVVGFIAISFFIVRNITTRAEVADFYPSTCLGTWQNPSNAQGEPENMKSLGTPAVFDDGNSAVLAPSSAEGLAPSAAGGSASFTASQIYCGGFLPPDYEPKGEMTNVGLTLVWQMEFNAAESPQSSTTAPTAPTSTLEIPPAPTSTPPEVEPSTSTPSETEPPLPSLNESGEVTPGEVEPTEPSTTTQSFLFKNFRGVFINLAFAEEESGAPAAPPPPTEIPANDNALPPQQDAAPPIDSSLPQETISTGAETAATQPSSTDAETPQMQSTTSTTEASKTIILGPPLKAELGPVTSSVETAGEASTTVEEASGMPAAITSPAPQPPTPDENFLRISYSTDGQTWVEIAKANKDNWKNLTLSLPVKNWDELGKIQIRIESIPTTAQTPRVYLDGMFLEVHYEVTASFDLQILQPAGNESSTPETSAPPMLGNAPNPFPGLPQVILPKSGDVKTQRRDWSGRESPTIDIDINGLPAAEEPPANAVPEQSSASSSPAEPSAATVSSTPPASDESQTVPASSTPPVVSPSSSVSTST